MKNNHGVSLIAAVFIIVILGFMGVMFVSMISTGSLTAANDAQSAQALYVAEGGLESTVMSLHMPNLANRIACGNVTNNADFTNEPLGQGQFTVTGATAYTSPPTTLNGAITSAATTITVNSIAGYSQYGRIMIDRELIDYFGAAGNAFLNAVRGRDGTTAAAHASGTRVGQYQCTITSQGGIPSVLAPSAMRTVSEGVQLQEGWIVGANSAATPAGWLVSRFNTPPAGLNTWGAPAVNTPGVNAVQLNSVAMLSYADGWAVGVFLGATGGATTQRWAILRWNGAAWSRFVANTAPVVATSLNSVYLTSAADGWAVGVALGATGGAATQRWTFLRWNGANWSRFIVNTPGTNAVTLNSVFMVSPTDGWAVGTQVAAATNGWTFLQWNGAAWSRFVVNTAPVVATSLNSVYLISATNGWAVGVVLGATGGAATQRWTFLRWNGANWSRFIVNTPGTNAVTLNSVFMVSPTDGWAVGNAAGGNEVIFRWNGVTWTRMGPYAAVPNIQLNSVHCVDSDDCWAVGNASGGETIIHWDGTTWTRVGPSAAIPNQPLRSIYIIGPRRDLQAAWQEVFP